MWCCSVVEAKIFLSHLSNCFRIMRKTFLYHAEKLFSAVCPSDQVLLTVNADSDPFADARWNWVLCDAQVSSHIQTWYPGNFENFRVQLENFRGQKSIKFLPETTENFFSLLSDLFTFIFVLSSRFHLIVGWGEPCALHFKVTLEPSRTITSLELNESSIDGGTLKEKKSRREISLRKLQ